MDAGDINASIPNNNTDDNNVVSSPSLLSSSLSPSASSSSVPAPSSALAPALATEPILSSSPIKSTAAAGSNKYKILNEAHLLRQLRCVNFNHKCREQLDQLCEDKVSKFKSLERVHYSLPSSVKSTFIMTFSPDGRKVASTHGDHCIYICDLNTGKLLDTLYGHPRTPWCLAWHPSNKDILASGCLAGEVRVWDLGSRTKAPESWTSENNSIISSLDFHPHERVLVIATANDILFWDWGQPTPFAKTTTTHDKEKVKFVEFDPSGTRLITGISNLPRFSGYSSSDSLQNRIIDSYLTPGSTIEAPPHLQTTENMTGQNSENNNTQNNATTTPLIINNPHDGTSTAAAAAAAAADSASLAAEIMPFGGSIPTNNRPSSMPLSPMNNNEQQQVVGSFNINQLSTLTLSRIAYLYRQLENLEVSMRHTTFAPYPDARPTFDNIQQHIANEQQQDNQPQQQRQQQQQQLAGSNKNRPSTDNEDTSSVPPIGSPTNVTSSQGGEQSSQSSLLSTSSSSQGYGQQQQQQQAQQQPTRSPNSFEPFVVSFDESLENLQLSPLVIDGQTVNLATMLEQYSLEFPHQVHFMMHYESINQVNQNFIRISKLMSSIRLYRQVVQQISSSNSGQGHFQPNQLLTAQSTSLGSPRSPGGVPIIFRNIPSVGVSGQSDAIGNSFRSRPSDPVMAIQFRSSARNVPLVTICKIDLLSARSVCIWRSQALIEQAMIDLRRSIRTYQISLPQMMGANTEVTTQVNDRTSTERTASLDQPTNYSFHHLLSDLHQSLTAINHAPLTTSNVHTHITSLRTVVNRLLNTLTALLPTQEEGRRLIDLVHDIAHSLTGRSWSIPLGATLDDIRFDVIHTMCIVDLSLHLTRQIQLLQMHRLSAIARIEEYRRASANTDQVESPPTLDNTAPVGDSISDIASSSNQIQHPIDNLLVPSTSRESQSSAIDQHQMKRKNQDQTENLDDIAKRRRVESEVGLSSNNNDIEMIDTGRDVASSDSSASLRETNSLAAASGSMNTLSPTQVALHGSPLSDNMPVERLIVWNSSQGQADEQSLQRFLVATAASMNSHILLRIYHRAGGNPSNILDAPGERIIVPIESRRRALSQDNSSAPSLPPQESVSPPVVDNGRARYVPQSHHAPPIGGGVSPGGSVYDTWHRTPHFHVIHARHPGQHLWFNQWTISLPPNSNYRLQCWNFSLDAIPNIKDSQSNIVTQKCRIMNDSSIDISSDGSLLACLVPREEGTCMPNLDLKIFSLKTWDFGTCYHQIPHGSNAVSVSLSPTANYAVVGLASHKYISNDPSDDLTIAKIFNLCREDSSDFVRDIKIKRDDNSLTLNAIRWMPRGIVYNVGPQHHQRSYTARMRNRFV